jgi:hypothetical protein
VYDTPRRRGTEKNLYGSQGLSASVCRNRGNV